MTNTTQPLTPMQSIPRNLPSRPSVVQALVWRDAWLLGPPPLKGGRGVTLAHMRRLISALPAVDRALYEADACVAEVVP